MLSSTGSFSSQNADESVLLGMPLPIKDPCDPMKGMELAWCSSHRGEIGWSICERVLSLLFCLSVAVKRSVWWIEADRPMGGCGSEVKRSQTPTRFLPAALLGKERAGSRLSLCPKK